MPSIDIDFTDWKRAQDSIGQGALTNSKNPNMHVFGVYPTHFEGGGEAYLYTENNERYLDYICGLGTNLFGYGYPPIAEAVARSLYTGTSHSFPMRKELELAERLKEIFYFIDKWKFLKTGSEACNAAIRMSRSFTGRSVVLSSGYHGHADDFVSLTPPAAGIPGRDWICSFNNISDLLRFELGSVAAVIVEPVMVDSGADRLSFLQELRQICTKNGIVLIFDEVITGFRFKQLSVAAWANIRPDLFIIGKAMAGGMPLAAVGGNKDILDGDYFVSSTYAGDTASLTASLAVCDLLTKNPSFRIDRLWEAGERFVDKFNKTCGEFVKITGYPTRGVFEGEALNKALLFQEACKAKILLGPSWFYNFPLMKYDDYFFSFLNSFVQKQRLGEHKLEGKMPQSPFAAKVRQNAG